MVHWLVMLLEKHLVPQWVPLTELPWALSTVLLWVHVSGWPWVPLMEQHLELEWALLSALPLVQQSEQRWAQRWAKPLALQTVMLSDSLSVIRLEGPMVRPLEPPSEMWKVQHWVQR